MKVKIYHNPRCKNSRAGLMYLKERVPNVEVIDYLTVGLSVADLMEILQKSGLTPAQLVRTSETYYKENLKGMSFDTEGWVRVIVDNPKLLQRPFVVAENGCVLGNPPENIDKLIK